MKLLLALLLSGPAFADHDTKAALDRGTYVQTAVVTGSSFTGTAFAAAAAKRMDGIYFNNTSSVVWIGTTTTNIAAVEHSNVTIGFPVASSAVFKLDGIMSGAVNFTCNNAVATCEVRSLESLNR